MRRIRTWFFLSCKRHVCRLSFFMILLLFPLGTFLLRNLQKDGESSIRIAVCAEPDAKRAGKGQKQTLEQEVVLALTEGQTDGLFQFYQCDSEEEVKDEVASKRAECGYVILAGLRELINFLIMALVIFSIVKAMNAASSRMKPREETAAPRTKTCPFCRSEIALEAVRCPHCTSILEEDLERKEIKDETGNRE